MTAQFNEAQLEMIIGSARESALAGKAMQKAQERAAGAYTGTIVVAMEFASDPVAFDEAMGDLFEKVRANVDGLAVKVKAPKAEKGGYKVPGALSSARSVLKSAFEYGVSLTDEETGEPRTFGAIRKDVKAEKDAAADSERTEEQVLRDEVAAKLRELADAIATTGEVDGAMAAYLDELRTSAIEAAAAWAGVSGAPEADVAKAA